MFDVFVSGIDPDRHQDLDEIRQNISNTLGIKGENLELLLAANGELICIQENVPENKAIKICNVLKELGLLCSYEVTQTKRWENLAEAEPYTPQYKNITCKVCNKIQLVKFEDTGGICEACLKELELARQIEDEIAEIEALRKSLILEAQLEEQHEEELRSKQEQLKKNAEMEEQTNTELEQQTKFPTFIFDPPPFVYNYIIPALLLALSIAGFTAYFFWPAKDNDKPEAVARQVLIPGQSETDAKEAELKNVSSKPEPRAQFPSTADIANAIPVPVDGESSKSGGENPAYRNVSQYLMTLQTEIESQILENNTRTVAKQKVSAKFLFLNHLYHELDADPEWNYFLLQQAEQLINAGKFSSAFKFSQFQTDLSDHISIIAKLLTEFSGFGRKDLQDVMLSKLTQRINAQTQEMRAIYTADLALPLQKLGIEQNGMEIAEQMAANLKDPIQESRVFSHMAVLEKNAGLEDIFNKHFALAQEKLKQAPLSFAQFSGFIDLSGDYVKSGNSLNAEVAIILAELTLIKLDPTVQNTGLAMLLQAAYQINNPAYIKKYVESLQDNGLRSKAGLQSIETNYHAHIQGDINKQIARISEPDFLVLAFAYAGLLEIDPVLQKVCFDNAEQKLAQITDNAVKALASSKLARFMYRQHHINPALKLFDQSLVIANDLPDSRQHDAVLILLANDRARVFLSESAIQAANFIHDEVLKADVLEMLKKQESLLVGMLI